MSVEATQLSSYRTKADRQYVSEWAWLCSNWKKNFDWQKQVTVWIWPVGHSWPTSDLEKTLSSKDLLGWNINYSHIQLFQPTKSIQSKLKPRGKDQIQSAARKTAAAWRSVEGYSWKTLCSTLRKISICPIEPLSQTIELLGILRACLIDLLS